jgi:hypothetical protein
MLRPIVLVIESLPFGRCCTWENHADRRPGPNVITDLSRNASIIATRMRGCQRFR